MLQKDFGLEYIMFFWTVCPEKNMNDNCHNNIKKTNCFQHW